MSLESNYSVRDAFLSQVPLEKYLQKIFPRHHSKEYISESAAFLKDSIRKIFETNLLQTRETAKNLTSSRSHLVSVLKKDEKELRLLCYPKELDNLQDTMSRSNGFHELLACEFVVPLDVQNSSFYTSHIDYGATELYEQEARGRALLKEKIPDFYEKLRPLYLYNFSKISISSKGPNYKTLANELENNRFSLSASNSLKILRQIVSEIRTLSNHGLVYSYVHPSSISIQRCENRVTGHLNEFLYLTPEREPCTASHSYLDPLACHHFASFNTDRYGLVQLMATLFSLQPRVSDSYDMEKQEHFALSQLEKDIFPEHYQKILELKRQYGGFHKGFSKALLEYVDGLKLQEEEGFQIFVLEQFAEKMAIFPQISALLKQVIEVALEQKKRLQQGAFPATLDEMGPHMPSLHKIGLVLQQGEKALRELSACRKSIPTEVLQVRKDHIRQLITQISKSTAHAESHVERLYQELNRYLQERPAVGTEKRFHKEPFSFRVCVGLKRVFVYPIGPFLGGGEYKTAKASWRAEISSDRIAIEKQMMSRSRHQEPEDIKMHHAILKIPGAEKYFVELPRRHAGYFGSNGKMKWEAHRSLYHDSLDVVINRQGLYTDPSDRESFLPLTMQDFISFLKNTIQGVDLIRQHRISHGDIKLSNIGIFVGPEKSCTSRITDFDWSSYFPAQLPADSDTYVYWDARRRTLGEVSEKTDLYGLVLLVSSVFLIGVQQQLAMEGDKTIHEMFQRICENPKEEKKEFLKKHLKSLETIGLKVNGPLAKESCGVIFEKIKSWQNTANHRRSLFLKAWLCKSLCFDRVFSLLEQALKADQKDSTFAYPTTQDIQNVLDACQQDAMWIDEQCK